MSNHDFPLIFIELAWTSMSNHNVLLLFNMLFRFIVSALARLLPLTRGLLRGEEKSPEHPERRPDIYRYSTVRRLDPLVREVS